MIKGPDITDEIKVLVSKLHESHPKWTNKKIRLEVQKIKHREDETLAEKYPKWPSTFSIDRIMADVKKRKRLRQLTRDLRDNPWTIQSLAKYPIPRDALPSVLEAWFLVQSLKPDIKQIPSVTIRQSQWVARLYTVIKDTRTLLTYSMGMADLEKQAEDAGLDYYGSQWDTLEIFSQMAGRQFTDKEKREITGLSGHYVTRVGLEEAKLHMKEMRK